jgi:excisionase family DNA binding protein
VTDTTEPIDALAYPPAQAAKVAGRSHTRIKKAIREKELTARKDGRATLIERAELQRWLANLPTIGRELRPEASR